MITDIFLVDPDIHPLVRESLGAAELGLRLRNRPEGASAFVTEDRDVDKQMLEAAGRALRAIFLLEPGSAEIAKSRVPVHRIGNPALLGVAEHTVLLMLALAKRLPWILEKTRSKAWLDDRSKPVLTDQKKYTYNWVGLKEFGLLGGRTVGLVGLGYIAKATARILRGFSSNVIYYKPKRLSKAEEADLGVEWRELDDLLERSDYVSLHHRFVEGPDGNDKQFDSDAFRRMKRTAFFINTARGRMVDEDALCEAVRSGHIAGAALDVFRYEPLPDYHPFFDLPSEKVILTPHVGGVPVKEAAEAVAREIVETLAKE
jgi:phosphoglycerate dehydrogenase-like enzyme